MANDDLESLRGCIHNERPREDRCENCGEQLCYDCYIDAPIGSIAIERTSVDQRTKTDYARFCAACYLEWWDKKIITTG